ncbi:hypothetical protein ES703_91620 [subsurface metagenome]
MSKAKKYWILAMGMAVFGLAQAVSGFVLWLGFPTGGGGGGRGWGGGGGLGNLTFWELSKHTWIDIHDWVAVALVVLVIIHLILHWKWIARMAKSMFKVTRKSLVPVSVRND